MKPFGILKPIIFKSLRSNLHIVKLRHCNPLLKFPDYGTRDRGPWGHARKPLPLHWHTSWLCPPQSREFAWIGAVPREKLLVVRGVPYKSFP